MCSLQVNRLRISFLTSLLKNYVLHNAKNLYSSVHRLHADKSKNDEVELIDNYVNQLMKERREKWLLTNNKYAYKSKAMTLKPNKAVNISEIISTDSQINQTNKQILNALTANKLYDIQLLLKECSKEKICLPISTMILLFSKYSSKGDIETIKVLQAFYTNVNPKVSDENADFKHYLAKALWLKGNVDEALKTFIIAYKTSYDMKFMIRVLLKPLIMNTMRSGSEASIVILKKHVIYFAEDLNEWIPLLYFWQSCWLSEWFTDKEIADTLFNKYETLRLLTVEKLPIMSSLALKQQNIDAVLRIMELLLKNDMKDTYTLIIRILFDYKYKEMNFNGCAEIIDNCSLLNINLRANQYEKFYIMEVACGKHYDVKTPEIKIEPVENFTFKF